MVADEGWPLPGPGNLPAAPGPRGENHSMYQVCHWVHNTLAKEHCLCSTDAKHVCVAQAHGQAAAAEDAARQPLAALRDRFQQQQAAAGQPEHSLEGRLAAQGLEGRLLLLLGMLLMSAMAAATAGIVAPLIAGRYQASGLACWGVCSRACCLVVGIDRMLPARVQQACPQPLDRCTVALWQT